MHLYVAGIVVVLLVLAYWWASRPRKMTLSGFNYADCDGVYVQEAEGKFRKDAGGKSERVLRLKDGVIDVYNADESGWFGRRTVVTGTPGDQQVNFA